MKIFLDTEFREYTGLRKHDRYCDLISIGLVREDDSTYYAENIEYHPDPRERWLNKNVHPKLEGASIAKAPVLIAQEVLEFCGPDPEFWAWYSATDWVNLYSLFGTMLEAPRHWPHYCMDLKVVMRVDGTDKFDLNKVILNENEHHALSDALWLKKAHDFYFSHRQSFAPILQMESLVHGALRRKS